MIVCVKKIMLCHLDIDKFVQLVVQHCPQARIKASVLLKYAHQASRSSFVSAESKCLQSQWEIVDLEKSYFEIKKSFNLKAAPTLT